MGKKSELKVVISCPKCRVKMSYNREDKFYQCPQCQGQFWPADTKMPCPGCGKPMRYVSPGYYKCSGCESEFWPQEETQEEEEEPEPKRRYYAGLGLVYLEEIRRGDGRSKSSSGRKRKKPRTGPRVISQRYLLQ